MKRSARSLTWTLAATACVLGLSSGLTARADDADIELLFVQTSEGLEVDAEAGTFRLVDFSPHTLYFSDRPNRLAGHITMDDYLKEWTEAPDDFDDDPPNATLSVYEPGRSESSLVVVEILNPVVDGEDLVYDYRLIDGAMPVGGGMAALFIDRIGPGGGVGAGYHGVGVGARGPGAAGWAGVAARNCADTDC
jgi:hypothetical protein